MQATAVETNLQAVKTAHTALEGKQRERHERHMRVLTELRSADYWEVAERADFYIWFYEQLLTKKFEGKETFEVRWPLAAAFVATQVREGTARGMLIDLAIRFGLTSDIIQGLLRRGNQVIFDDVLAKLKKLWNQTSPLTDQAAVDWDGDTLSEEQNLIQPLYERLSPKELETLRTLAYNEGVFVQLGACTVENELLKLLNGPGRRQQLPPPFKGDLQQVRDRWLFGMGIGASLSTLTVEGTIPQSAPAPRAIYLDDTALKAVDTRPNLHFYEALTDNFTGSITELEMLRIVEALKTFNESEQRLFLAEPRFVDRMPKLLGRLQWNILFSAIATFKVDLEAQLLTLDKFDITGGPIIGKWRLVDYPEVRPMILAAPPAQRAKIRGPRWRDVFVDICENDTIIQAVDDLGLTNPERQEWIDAER